MTTLFVCFDFFYNFLYFLMFSNVGCCLINQLINGSFEFYNNLNFINFIFLLVIWFLSFERTFKSGRHEAFIFFFSHNDIEKKINEMQSLLLESNWPKADSNKYFECFKSFAKRYICQIELGLTPFRFFFSKSKKR